MAQSTEITITNQDIELDRSKFKDVALYVIQQTSAKPNVGETVLHKLLYFIDFDYYELHDQYLTGETYMNNQHGPTSRNLKATLAALEHEGAIERKTLNRFGHTQKKCVALCEAIPGSLSKEELKHIDAVLSQLSDLSARSIEEHSHGDIPWLASKRKEDILYDTVFYRDARYSKRKYKDAL